MSDQNIGAGDAKVRLESALQQLMLLALSGKPYLPVKNGIGSPAGWFLFERMTSPHPGDQDIRRDIRKANACSGLYGDSVERERRFVGEKYKRALLDLLASDIPLTQDERQHIAELLARPTRRAPISKTRDGSIRSRAPTSNSCANTSSDQSLKPSAPSPPLSASALKLSASAANVLEGPWGKSFADCPIAALDKIVESCPQTFAEKSVHERAPHEANGSPATWIPSLNPASAPVCLTTI